MFVKFLCLFFDDKRFILDDGNSNGAYFHKNVKS